MEILSAPAGSSAAAAAASPAQQPPGMEILSAPAGSFAAGLGAPEDSLGWAVGRAPEPGRAARRAMAHLRRSSPGPARPASPEPHQVPLGGSPPPERLLVSAMLRCR